MQSGRRIFRIEWMRPWTKLVKREDLDAVLKERVYDKEGEHRDEEVGSRVESDLAE